MYYYISEPPRSSEERRAHEQARALLTNLGISGEFVTTSPARSVEELAELGAAKKYSTIVAMGSERLINEVATLLAGTPYVFGALPVTAPRCLELVSGITTLEEAAESLKYRRVRLVPITRIEPNKFFLTEARIRLSKPSPLRLTIDRALIEAEFSDLRLAGSGRILVENRLAGGTGVKQLWQWVLGKEQRDTNLSQFNAQRIALETDGNYPVYVGTEILAKTPLAATVIPGSLKLVVKRDRLAAVSAQPETLGRTQYATTNG